MKSNLFRTEKILSRGEVPGQGEGEFLDVFGGEGDGGAAVGHRRDLMDLITARYIGLSL